jgi:hypothetical protein
VGQRGWGDLFFITENKKVVVAVLYVLPYFVGTGMFSGEFVGVDVFFHYRWLSDQ